MKKALSVFLMLALVGSVFAAEPVADVNIAEFKGEASVQWGVDFDTMKTGFKNSTSTSLKLNLLNEGSKSTTGDGVWGELVIKTDGATFEGGLTALELKGNNVVVDKAQINFGPAYIGITAGNTETGELKMDAAVRSADGDKAIKIADVGPKNYSQGIVAGYTHDMFNVAVDLRSYKEMDGIWKVEWQSNVIITDQYNGQDVTNPMYFYGEAAADLFKLWLDEKLKSDDNAVSTKTKVGDYGVADNQYTNSYAFALEAEFTGVENLSVKAGASYNFGEKVADSGDVKDTLGYSASVGYKLALNDTFYLRPQVGFTGSHNLSNKDDKGSYNVAGGLLFGWGDIGIDANPGVYYMDTDDYKKVSPGVGVVVYAGDVQNSNGAITITPSFFSGEIIPGLTAATYGNIVVGTGDNSFFGYDMASSAKYDIPVGAGTITPKAGVYLDGNKEKLVTFSTKVGVDVAGFVDNTTFFTVYESGNLLKEENIGTLNFGAKISF